MLIIKSQSEFDTHIIDGKAVFAESVRLQCDISCHGNLACKGNLYCEGYLSCDDRT